MEFLYIMIGITIVMFFTMAYGDFKENKKWPWSKKSNNGINSGAKFG